MEKSHQIVKSKNGQFLIMTEHYTIFPNQNCILKCFNMEEDWEEWNKEQILPYSMGHRFDTHTHNWICIKEFINFSFSYMTFVIQEKILKMDSKESVEKEFLFNQGFDIEAFN